jgi:hypothetical protein
MDFLYPTSPQTELQNRKLLIATNLAQIIPGEDLLQSMSIGGDKFTEQLR